MKNSIINQYPDLKKYRRNGILTPFLFTAIYEILFIVLIIFLNLNNLFVYSFLFYAILVIIGLLPIILFKPFNFLFDKDYKGKVEKIEYKELINSNSQIPVSYVNGIGDLQDERSTENMQCWQQILIKTSKGKTILYNAKPTIKETHQKEGIPMASFDVKNFSVSPLIDYYKIGDEIEHISGFRFNRKLNLKPNDKNICIVCGTLNQLKDDCCINCGHSIIK